MKADSIVNHDNKLKIFERFVIDKTLPKFKDREAEVDKKNRGEGRSGNTSVIGTSVFDNQGTAGYLVTTSSNATTSTWSTGSTGMVYITQQGEAQPPTPEQLADPTIPRITIQQFFQLIPRAGGLLSNLRYRRKVAALRKLMEQCIENGQLALRDLTEAELIRLGYERNLCTHGFKMYVQEQELVMLYRALDEKDRDLLRLEWMKNFCRIVPQKLIKRKKKADKLGLFDNYVVLHVTPDWYPKDKERNTKADIDKVKDPILFGVSECSRRLYFIGDWIDQHCYLTLSELMDKMGKHGIDANHNLARIDTEVQMLLCQGNEVGRIVSEQ